MDGSVGKIYIFPICMYERGCLSAHDGPFIGYTQAPSSYVQDFGPASD